MELLPDYEESHLVVAAVRILSHRDGRSPTPEDVASFLGFSTEKIYVLVHELKKLGALRVLESPFERRLDVGDPAPLETLPRGKSGPSIEGELSEFHEREKGKRARIERMFLGGEAEKRRKDRVSRLEKEFTKFKPKPGALQDLFKAEESGKAGQDEPGGAGSKKGESEGPDGKGETPDRPDPPDRPDAPERPDRPDRPDAPERPSPSDAPDPPDSGTGSSPGRPGKRPDSGR